MPAAGVPCHITQRGEITAKLPPLAMRIRSGPFGFWGAESGASRNGPAGSRPRLSVLNPTCEVRDHHSELKPQASLEYLRCRCAGGTSKVGDGQIGDGVVQIHAVENIESVETHLSRQPLGYGKPLGY